MSMMNRREWLFVCRLAMIVTLAAPLACAAPRSVESHAGTVAPHGAQGARAAETHEPTRRLSDLTVWDNGSCEIAYYRATDRLYGTPRAYTRVQLLNRQWMSRSAGVKAEAAAPGATPVFKLNISEEIPTENYNYRYLTTLFLERPTLAPFKMVVSSQEWCGTTYKHLRWSADGLDLSCFSYFGEEGDKQWHVDDEAVPYEALLVIARDVVATGEPRTLKVLAPMRSNRAVEPTIHTARLVPGASEPVALSSGKFQARRVDLEWDGQLTGFLVEAKSPYRLLRYKTGPARGELVHIERRAYWDRSRASTYYEQGNAP